MSNYGLSSAAASASNRAVFYLAVAGFTVSVSLAKVAGKLVPP